MLNNEIAVEGETLLAAPFHIVIVEDEVVTRAKLAGYFETEGYRVSEAENGEDMRAILARDPADLLMIDINLPGEDGLLLTREQRSRSDVGIILVSGRSDDVDRIVGLEIGADDYVTKPFNQRELLARVKGLLRRSASRSATKPPVARFAGWTFDIARRRLTSPEGETVDLTRAEYQTLVAFVQNPGVVLSRERLLRQVMRRAWDPYDRTVDVLVGRLRRKLEPERKMPELIVTAHGEGYLFTAEIQ